MVQSCVLQRESERVPQEEGEVSRDGFGVGESLEGRAILEERGPVHRWGWGTVPVGEVLGDQIMNGRCICEETLLHLQAVERVEFGVLLEDGGDDPLKFTLFAKGFPLTCGLTDLSAQF